MPFDPDAFLSSESGFDPDAYLATPEQPAAEPQNIDASGIGFDEVARAMVQGAYADVAGGVSGVVHGTVGGVKSMLEGGDFETGFGDAGVDALKQVQEAYGYQPQTKEGQEYMEILAEFYPIKKIGEIAQAYKETMQDMGHSGDAGALRTSLAIAGPVALLDFIGAKIPGAAAKIPARAAASQEAKVAKLGGEIEELRAADIEASGGAPTEAGIEQVSEVLQKGTPEEIALAVNPDPAFYKASDELGINTEPLASFASQNPQYRAVEGGLASMPASQLDMQTKAYVSDVALAADRIIEQYGGTKDKAELSTRFNDESLRTIDDIYEAESVLYDAIETSLPGQTRVNPTHILSFIDDKVARSGGWVAFAKQNPRLAKMYRQLKPKTTTKKGAFDFTTGKTKQISETTNPTYEVLNDIRREIGQQLGRKGSTTFKDTETGILKALYGRLKEDQNSAAGKLDNGQQLIESADAMTIQRKQIEDNLKNLMGKDLQKDLMPMIGSAVKGLAKGDLKTFKAKIDAVPDKYRTEVLVSALNDVFRGQGVNNSRFDATQFTKFMNSLNESPETKRLLYSYLPDGAPRALDNLNKVAKGISQAFGDRITTGRLSAFFNDQDGLMRKLMKGGVALAASKVAGPLASMGVADLMKQSSDIAKATGDLLASSGFQNTIRSSIREGAFEGAEMSRKTQLMEKALMKSTQYKKWAALIDESALARISSVGLMHYLLTEEEPTNQ